MDKRYQVFISSTYADLKEERRRVIQTVMELDCIPAGMELFPATDEEQFEFIKRVIDDCDYYLLIIGGRYGSTTEDGISYTEKEYDYAAERGIKVVALLHEKPDEIPFGKSEQDPTLRERLREFRQKVETNRLVKFWKTADELPGLVSLSLSKTIKMFPAVGWVRANRAASEDLLNEINELRKEKDQLRKDLAEAKLAVPQADLPDLAGLDERFQIHGTHYYTSGGGPSRRDWSNSPTWRQIFALISPYLLGLPTDKHVQKVLGADLYKETEVVFRGTSPSIDDQDFQTISVQLKALGLVNIDYLQTTNGGRSLFWSLTPAGNQLMVQLRAIRTSTNNDEVNQ